MFIFGFLCGVAVTGVAAWAYLKYISDTVQLPW